MMKVADLNKRLMLTVWLSPYFRTITSVTVGYLAPALHPH